MEDEAEIGGKGVVFAGSGEFVSGGKKELELGKSFFFNISRSNEALARIMALLYV